MSHIIDYYSQIQDGKILAVDSDLGENEGSFTGWAVPQDGTEVVRFKGR